MNKNISDQLVETLVKAGIQRIYALTGDSLNHVNAAIYPNGKIKWIHIIYLLQGLHQVSISRSLRLLNRTWKRIALYLNAPSTPNSSEAHFIA